MADKRPNRKRQGANRIEAGKYFQVDPQTIDDWGEKRWLVRFPDRSIDLESTAVRVDALRDPFVGGKPNRGVEPKTVPLTGADAQTQARARALDDDGEMIPPDGIAPYIELTEARRLKEVAEAGIAQMKEAQMRGDLIKREDAERVFCDSVAKAKANLEAIPNRCAELLVGQTDAATVRAILTREIEGALSVVCGEVPSV